MKKWTLTKKVTKHAVVSTAKHTKAKTNGVLKAHTAEVVLQKPILDPHIEFGKPPPEAVDQTRVCGPVRRLSDMSMAERGRLEHQLGAPIKPPDGLKIDPALEMPVSIEKVVCRSSTEGGMRISYHGQGQWIPRSMILPGNILKTPGCTGTLVVPRWFALKLGLIADMQGLSNAELDFLRLKITELLAEWRRRIREDAEDLSSEFNRGVRVGMRACALDLIKTLRLTGEQTL